MGRYPPSGPHSPSRYQRRNRHPPRRWTGASRDRTRAAEALLAPELGPPLACPAWPPAAAGIPPENVAALAQVRTVEAIERSGCSWAPGTRTCRPRPRGECCLSASRGDHPVRGEVDQGKIHGRLLAESIHSCRRSPATAHFSCRSTARSRMVKPTLTLGISTQIEMVAESLKAPCDALTTRSCWPSWANSGESTRSLPSSFAKGGPDARVHAGCAHRHRAARSGTRTVWPAAALTRLGTSISRRGGNGARQARQVHNIGVGGQSAKDPLAHQVVRNGRLGGCFVLQGGGDGVQRPPGQIDRLDFLGGREALQARTASPAARREARSSGMDGYRRAGEPAKQRTQVEGENGVPSQ